MRDELALSKRDDGFRPPKACDCKPRHASSNRVNVMNPDPWSDPLIVFPAIMPLRLIAV
jgi:hypothetical protein